MGNHGQPLATTGNPLTNHRHPQATTGDHRQPLNTSNHRQPQASTGNLLNNLNLYMYMCLNVYRCFTIPTTTFTTITAAITTTSATQKEPPRPQAGAEMR